jgi:hypothetical protein
MPEDARGAREGAGARESRRDWTEVRRVSVARRVKARAQRVRLARGMHADLVRIQSSSIGSSGRWPV